MKRKVLTVLMTVLAIFVLLPFVSYADSVSVVFKNADTATAINEFAEAKNINAEISFTQSKTGKANVITAGYNASGALLSVLTPEALDVVSGETVHTTKAFDVTGIETVKIFVWMKDSMSPVINSNGYIAKAFSVSSDFSQKFNALAGVTQDEPFVCVRGGEVSAGELFEAVSGVEINNKYFNILYEPVGGSTASAEFSADASGWENATVTFSGEGLVKLTALDYDFCIPKDMYVNVISPVDRYETVFQNADTYLYRVGNANSVSLNSLFDADDSAELPVLDTTVTVKNVQGTANGTFAANADNWKNGSVKFSGTGVVEVAISDKNSNPCSLLLEVVDGENVTTVKNATSNNIVLLNDTSGTFSVSNDKTFYGNGFTVTLPTTHLQYGKAFTGYVTLGTTSGQGGNLDNVRIVGPVYPEMKIYSDDAEITDENDSEYGAGNRMRYFKNSVIIMGGYSTISNSYISGSRTALCIQGGNVVVDNTTLSGGAYANMNICSGISVTLKNLTTVQTDVLDSYGKGVYTHGLGVVVDSNVVDINIEGELRQNNWVCEEQWNRILPSGYENKFPQFFTSNEFSSYWHYLNSGEKYVNLGFIFRCNWDTNKIHDGRNPHNYITQNVNVLIYKGGIYSKANANGDAITDLDIQEPIWSPSGFSPVAPVFTFDNTNNADTDDANDAYDTYCVYKEGELNIGVKSETKILDLTNVTVKKNGVEIPYTVYFNGVKISGTSVTVSADSGISQSLVFKTTIKGLGYDASGNPIDGEHEYTWNIPINVATLSYPAPEWNMGGVYKFNTDNCCYVYYSDIIGGGEAVPVYEGVQVNYYNKEGNLIEADLSGTTVLPTGSNNSNTNAFTYTLSDGSTLTMKYISGWKGGASTHQFAKYNDMIYVYPQSIDNDNYIRAKKTNQNFDIKISYTFTDPNGQATKTVTMNWYNPKASNGDVTSVQWKTFDSDNGKKPSSCVTGDTLVTLSDGSQKRLDALTYEDEMLVWDFYEGEYTVVPASYLQNHGYGNNTVIKLRFDDGTVIKAVNEHAFFDADLNEFAFINDVNVNDYLGHSFIKQDGDFYKTVKLESYEITEEYIEAYSILTYKYYNCFLEGMLSLTPSEIEGNLFMPFDVGEDMTFDKDKMQADIEKYGLYEYEEFKDKLTLVEFEALNMPYIKVAVGKGILTYDEVIFLLELHFSK